jgi:ribosomal protein L2
MLRPRALPLSSATTRPFLNFACRHATTSAVHQPADPIEAVESAPTEKRGPLVAAEGGGLLKKYTPRTPGLRHVLLPLNEHLYTGPPERSLTFPKIGHGKGGRNRDGQVTVRHRGGGHRRRIRTIDFQRKTPGAHVVERIEYDPNRSAHIALLSQKSSKEKSYIVAPEGTRAGDILYSYRSGIPATMLKAMGGIMDAGILAAKTAHRGNCLPIKMIPPGTQVHNIGSTKDKGAVFCRSAGTFATILGKEELPNGKEGLYVIVKLQSGETRKVHRDACATIGVVSNGQWNLRQYGKAGRSRWRNIRPTVRGMAMNAGTLHPDH